MRSMAIAALPSKWQPPMEFLTPAILAQHMERYGLTQAERQRAAQPGELRLVGQERSAGYRNVRRRKDRSPNKDKKISAGFVPDGQKAGLLEEVRFQWNRPIPQELFVPDSPEVKHQVH